MESCAPQPRNTIADKQGTDVRSGSTCARAVSYGRTGWESRNYHFEQYHYKVTANVFTDYVKLRATLRGAGEKSATQVALPRDAKYFAPFFLGDTST